MPAPNLNRHAFCLRLVAFACSFLADAAHINAQPLQFGIESPAPAELSPPHVELINGPTAARLEQARAFVADENWEEAVDAYQNLAIDDSDSDRMVAMDDNRYVSLPTYCQIQLAQLPPAGLAVYRRSVDPIAGPLYRDGVATRDENKLRRITNEMFCSSWGDDALLSLGELALERADYGAARRYWEQLSPLLRDPSAQPLWLALRDIKLEEHWPEVEKRWLERTAPPTWLAFPDTTIDLADVRARLILVSIRAGELDRAALELDAFQSFHPGATGRFGGQDGPYAVAIERLLFAAREWPELTNSNWPTFAGAQTRSSNSPPLGSILASVWQKPVSLPRFAQPKRQSDGFRPTRNGDRNRVPNGDEEPDAAVRESDSPLCIFPIVVDSLVAFSDGSQIRAIDLESARPALNKDGILYRAESDGIQSSPRQPGLNDVIQYSGMQGVPRHTLNEAGGTLYGRVVEHISERALAPLAMTGNRLVGVDLSRDGLVVFQVKPPDASWKFDGAPVSDGRRLWVAMRHIDIMPHAYVACFDVATGTQLWRRSIAAADSPGEGRGESTHNLLTLVGDRVFLNSNLGVVAALDAKSGEVCWLSRYERTSANYARSLTPPPYFDRNPSPCLYHDGLLIAASSDTPAIFALDAHTGTEFWTTDQFPDALHLLGVVRQRLIVSGNRLTALDVKTGKAEFTWPESEQAGVRGMGRGLVAGNEIFWPTRDSIYVLHALTGKRTRPPIPLGSLGDAGANLAAAHGHLVIATQENLMAFGAGPLPSASANPEGETVQKTGRLSNALTPTLD